MREVVDKKINQLMNESGFNIARNLKVLRKECNSKGSSKTSEY